MNGRPSLKQVWGVAFADGSWMPCGTRSQADMMFSASRARGAIGVSAQWEAA